MATINKLLVSFLFISSITAYGQDPSDLERDVVTNPEPTPVDPPTQAESALVAPTVLAQSTTVDVNEKLVRVYTECNYKGVAANLDVGNYNNVDLEALGIGNNQISSLQIPNGYKATLYNSYFTGRKKIQREDNRCLAEIGFDNITSSISIVVDSNAGLRPSSGPGRPEPELSKSIERGQAIYTDVLQACTGCHGADGLSTIFKKINLGADSFEHSSNPGSFIPAVEYIERFMPLSNPSLCVGRCAEDVVAYMKSIAAEP